MRERRPASGCGHRCGWARPTRSAPGRRRPRVRSRGRHPANLLVALPFYARCQLEAGRSAEADLARPTCVCWPRRIWPTRDIDRRPSSSPPGRRVPPIGDGCFICQSRRAAHRRSIDRAGPGPLRSSARVATSARGCRRDALYLIGSRPAFPNVPKTFEKAVTTRGRRLPRPSSKLNLRRREHGLRESWARA